MSINLKVILICLIIICTISVALLDETNKEKTSFHIEIPTEDDPLEDDKNAKTHHHIFIKHVKNLFACWDNWDSLDDCDIIQDFKYLFNFL
jgi:hypothetical protein